MTTEAEDPPNGVNRGATQSFFDPGSTDYVLTPSWTTNYGLTDWRIPFRLSYYLEGHRKQQQQETQDSIIKEKTESLQTYTDYLARIARWDAASKQIFRDYPETAALWHRMNIVNMIAGSEESDTAFMDCFTSQMSPNGAYIVPYSEQWITGLMVWLQGNGINPSDPFEAQRRKLSCYNLAPITREIGELMEPHKGGLLFMFTKKCMYRLCLVSLTALYDIVASDPRPDFSEFKVSSLTSQWAQRITQFSIKIRRGSDGQLYTPGSGFLELSGEDYKAHDLVLTADKVRSKAEVHNIFECHYMLTKWGLDPDTSTYTAQQPFVLRRTRLVQTFAGMVQKIPEELVWHPAARKRDKGLPLRNTVENVLDESEEDLGLGPKMFVPFDPIPATLMLWSSARRLLYDVSEGFRSISVEFKEIMQLTNFLLRISGINSLDQLWDIIDSAPSVFRDKHNFPPRSADIKLLDEKRLQPRSREEEQSTVDQLWTMRNDRFVQDEIIYQKRQRARKALREYRGECVTLEHNQDESKDETSISCSTVPTSEAIFDVICKPELHEDKDFTLGLLNTCIAELCLEKQFRFDVWVKKYGHSKALERQRRLRFGPVDKEIDRLWSEVVAIKCQYNVTCDHASFAYLSGMADGCEAEHTPSEKEREAEWDEESISADAESCYCIWDLRALRERLADDSSCASYVRERYEEMKKGREAAIARKQARLDARLEKIKSQWFTSAQAVKDDSTHTTVQQRFVEAAKHTMEAIREDELPNPIVDYDSVPYEVWIQYSIFRDVQFEIRRRREQVEDQILSWKQDVYSSGDMKDPFDWELTRPIFVPPGEEKDSEDGNEVEIWEEGYRDPIEGQDDE